MPNYIRVMMEILERYLLDRIIHSCKSYATIKANKILKRKSRFWRADCYDRYLRGERHLAATIQYVHKKPVKAGLVEISEDWLFSHTKLWEVN